MGWDIWLHYEQHDFDTCQPHTYPVGGWRSALRRIEHETPENEWVPDDLPGPDVTPSDFEIVDGGPFVERAARRHAVAAALSWRRSDASGSRSMGDAPIFAVPVTVASAVRPFRHHVTVERSVPFHTISAAFHPDYCPPGTLWPADAMIEPGCQAVLMTIEVEVVPPGGEHDAGWLFARWCG